MNNLKRNWKFDNVDEKGVDLIDKDTGRVLAEFTTEYGWEIYSKDLNKDFDFDCSLEIMAENLINEYIDNKNINVKEEANNLIKMFRKYLK